MSYDVWLTADLGGPEPVGVGGLDANCTWNLRPMFAAVVGDGPQDWDGKPATEVADICARILDAFNRDPVKFCALNPPNGWGNFEGARRFIETINDACRQAPSATFRCG